jgi:hypothetical protein
MFALLLILIDFIFAIQGLDTQDVAHVIQYGICRDVPNTLQHGGQGGHDNITEALFLIMYETWALKVDLNNIPIHLDDPDQPVIPITKKFKETSTNRSCYTPHHSIVQLPTQAFCTIS